MKYPFLAIITLFTLFVGVSSSHAQNCTPVENFDFDQITNSTIEMSWDPHLNAVSFELEYFLDGVSVGLYSLPGSSSAHIYHDNTGLLATAQTITTSIRVECPDPHGWSDLVTGNTETDIYSIDGDFDLCINALDGEGFVYNNSTKKKYNLYCFCIVKRDFLIFNGLENDIDVPRSLRAELDRLLEQCLMVRLNSDRDFDRRDIGFSGKWDGNEVNEVNSFNGQGNTIIFQSEQLIDEIVIYDVLGKQILMLDKLNSLSIELNKEDLNVGVYIYDVALVNGEHYNSKFYIAK